jgi:hypothetical protein
MEKKSGKGYCEKAVNNMLQVSNRKLCGGKQSKNVGFYYRTVFPVGQANMTYMFKTPSDFGFGGVSILDGKIMKQETKDIWAGGKSTQLDFTTTLSQGNHVLEIYGAEGCCDGTTKWQFAVVMNGKQSQWYEWTVVNFNRFIKITKETETPVVRNTTSSYTWNGELSDATISIKTTKFNKNVLKNFGALKTTMK